jgi:hypothetical protein
VQEGVFPRYEAAIFAGVLLIVTKTEVCRMVAGAEKDVDFSEGTV